MPSLSAHQSSSIVKLIYAGDSGTGKTGSLVSLVKAGYRLRILDLDNGLDSLVQFTQMECADKLSAVDFETRRDVFTATAYGAEVKKAKAFTDSIALMTKWSDGTDPASWGPDTIFVLDSLSAMGKAAFAWAQGLTPAAKDPRQWYFAAQQAIENTIALLTSEAFNTNLIVITHVGYREMQDGTTKGHPNAIGTALGPIIARYFNTMILAESTGSGTNVRREIRTTPTGIIDLKNPAPFKLDARLPLGTGLATLFEKLKEKKV